MSIEMALVGIGVFIALVAALAIWTFSTSKRTRAMQRAEIGARRVSQQPWAADRENGRGNR